MRKLNGITINGEYLGNSVVINGMFRAICTISPVIMRDFVQIINKIERLEDAVKIHNFNCGFDSIDIEFENTKSKGIASLYFKLINGEPELTNCKLVIDNHEYSTFADKITLPEPKAPMSEEERLNKIRELKQRKLEKLKQQKEALQQQKEALQQQKQSPMPRGPMQKPRGPLPPRPNQGVTPPKELTEEQRRRQKLQEIRERKKKLLEAQNKGMNVPSDDKSIGAATTSASKEAIVEDKNSESGAILNKNEDKLTEKSQIGGVENLNDENRSGVDADVKNTENSVNKTTDIAEGKLNAEEITQTAETSTENDGKNLLGEDGQAYSQSSDAETHSPDEISRNEDFAEGDLSQEDIENMDLSDEVYSGYEQPKKSLDDYTDEELENLSEEELANLEAELEAESGGDYGDYGDSYDYNSGYSDSYSDSSQYGGGFSREFAESLSQGLAEGLAQGLSQGLVQGLQGLQGLNFGGGQAAGMGSFDNSGFGQSTGGGYDFSNAPSSPQTVQYQQLPPDYNHIDDMNSEATLSARDTYSYDENSNLEDLSDLYSDFYEEKEQAVEEVHQEKKANDPNTSEVDALKAELEALKAETESKKDLMTLDEFMEKQKELAEAKEKKRRQKFRILGSKERINASALENGVFVAGNKVYKWGDTRILEE